MTLNKHVTSRQASILAGLSDKEIRRLTNICKQAAIRGGKILMKYYMNINEINSKSNSGDLVTNADIEAERIIINYLKRKTPDIGILAEESGKNEINSNLFWCIDPLDGTTNFTHGYPFFASSIGLMWKNYPILGSISIPYLKEIYWAAPGLGSFCNRNKIEVSKCNKLNESLLVTGFAYDRHTKIDNNYAEFCWLTHRTRGVRRGGAAAVDLAFVACGRIDGYWERGLAKWDLAAGKSIVELAGGEISNYEGEEFQIESGRILATTPGIKDELISELTKVSPLQKQSYGIQ